jgi:hypothetical protein
MYYMQTEQAKKTFRQSLDWLRQADGVVPVNHVNFTSLRNGDTEDAGRHELTWTPATTERGRLAAGFYVIRLQTETDKDVRKVLVLP